MKKTINSILARFGYQIINKKQLQDPFADQVRLIDNGNTSEITIFDLGANIGQTAKRYRALFPTSKIHSFEPFPSSIEKLKEAVAGDTNVFIVPKAVAEKEGTTTFYVNEASATNSLLPRPASQRRYFPKKANAQNTIEVELISIDKYSKDHDISQIDILKLDLQGGELNALKGAKELLKKSSISIIYTEIMFVAHYENAPYFNEIWNFLSEFGYTLYNVYDLTVATNGQLRYGDAIFVNESTRKDVIDNFPSEP